MLEMLQKIDMQRVVDHYEKRRKIHLKLRKLFDSCAKEDYVKLALGIEDACGNHSAREHENPLGPKIILSNKTDFIYDLAINLNIAEKNHIPNEIIRADLKYLKISVGSEMAMMLRPNEIWIGNKRTYWATFLITDGLKRANRELELFYDQDSDGAMEYKIWAYRYLLSEKPLEELGKMATKCAQDNGFKWGKLKFLWPDAASTFLFERFATKKKMKRWL